MVINVIGDNLNFLKCRTTSCETCRLKCAVLQYQYIAIFNEKCDVIRYVRLCRRYANSKYYVCVYFRFQIIRHISISEFIQNKNVGTHMWLARWTATFKNKVKLLHCLYVHRSQSNFTHARFYAHHSQHIYTHAAWYSAWSDVRRHYIYIYTVETRPAANMYIQYENLVALYHALNVYEWMSYSATVNVWK